MIAIPLAHDQWIVAVAARVARNGDTFYGYFFPVEYDSEPTMETLAPLPLPLDMDDSMLAAKCTTVGIEEGEWKIIGAIDLDRNMWPFPPMYREGIAPGTCVYTKYHEDDIDWVVGERHLPDDGNSSNLPLDEIFGDLAIVEFAPLLLEARKAQQSGNV